MGQESGFDITVVWEMVAGMLSQYGLRIVGALVLLLIGRIAAGLIRSAFRRGLERARVEPTLIPFFTGMVYYALIAFVIVAVLTLMGIQTTSFIAVLGAVGLAVGLALQGTLSNFAAGVMLLMFRPFRVDDVVETAGSTGKVIAVGVFSTTIHTGDNIRIIIPNSSIFGNVIKNFSANETRRIDLVVGISYDDEIARAIRTIEDLLDSDGRILKDPAPMVAVSELADSSINLIVRPWCRKEDYWTLRCDLTRKLKERLEAAGCSIPFPQRDVHLHPASRVEAV